MQVPDKTICVRMVGTVEVNVATWLVCQVTRSKPEIYMNITISGVG